MFLNPIFANTMLQPFISHQFKNPVWRLEIDNLTDVITAEIRDQSNKRAYFSAISLVNGEVYFDDLQTEERWLTGMEAAYNGVLLVHNYQSEAGPAHKGLIAFDERNGQLLWSNFNFAFDHLSVNGPVVYDTRIQPRKLSLIDIKTGATLRKYEPSIDLELINDLKFPEEASSESVSSLELPVSPLENTVHYLEHYNLRIVSLHAIAKGTLQQHLYIMDGVEIIYSDLLNADVQKLQPESFLLHKEHLIYLKNQSQLIVLNL